MRKSWKIKKLGHICTIYDSQRKPVTKKDRTRGDYPYYGATGIQDYVASYLFDGRYLLIGEDGAKWNANEQSAYIIEGKSWVNNHVHILQLDNDVIDSFVAYYLNYKDLNEYITGAVVPKLTQAALRDIPILIPPLFIQKYIVAELDKLNEILAKKREQLKELDRLGQALFYDMFGDPIHNVKNWKCCNLDQISNVGSSKRVFVEDLVESGVPFYRGTEISFLSSGDEIIPKLYITEEHYNRLKKSVGIPSCGDLLLPSICHEGKIWRVNTSEPFYFKDGRVLWIHINNKDVNGTYLQYMLREKIMKDYVNIASGTTFSELKIFALKKVLVILPPINLQSKFAEQMDAVDCQKQKIKQSIIEVQQLLDCTMNKYFG